MLINKLSRLNKITILFFFFFFEKKKKKKAVWYFMAKVIQTLSSLQLLFGMLTEKIFEKD